MHLLSEKLPKNQFLRVHKSYIVSLPKIKQKIGNILLVNDKNIPIGSFYKAELIKKLENK